MLRILICDTIRASLVGYYLNGIITTLFNVLKHVIKRCTEAVDIELITRLWSLTYPAII